MPLNETQLDQLHDAILGNTVWNAQPDTPDGNSEIARLLTLPVVPDYIVWKNSVAMVEIGRNINGAELGNLTTANHTRLQTVCQISGGFIDPSLADQRAFFADIFSGAGGTQTMIKLNALWRRAATESEKIFATGAGTTASPSVMGYTEIITYQEVGVARSMP
jgi:hypothetical protein